MKILIEQYTFDASAKTLTIDQFPTINLEQVRLVTNVTDGIIIFNFADPAKGAALGGGNVLTLEYDTTGMNDNDSLAIDFYDYSEDLDVTGPLTDTELRASDVKVTLDGEPVVVTGVATSVKQDTMITHLSAIETAVEGTLDVNIVSGGSSGGLTDAELRASPVPVSGTVTANLGTIGGAATESTLQSIETDTGTIAGAVSGSEMQVDIVTMPAVTISGSVPVTLSEPISIDDNGSSLTVDGTVTVTQATGTNLHTVIDSSALPTGASTAANQATIIGHVDGIEGLLTSIDADTGGILTAAQSIDTAVNGTLDVNIVSGASSSTQYTEGDTDATITGTVAMMEVAANTLQPVQGTVADGLLVNLGANNDVTISGTVTVDNGGTFAVQAAQSGTWNITNISGTISLPTGASTSANQSTIIGHLDGVEGLLTTIDADTSNISTKIDTIAGAVSGTEMQVDIITIPTVTVQATNLDIRDLTFANDKVDASGTVLGAGTNNIGDVDVLSLPSIPTGSNTIGSVRITDGTDTADVLDLTNSNPLTVAIVDGTGNQITSFGGGTQYTEDVASAADPVGGILNARRRNPLSLTNSEVSADGDVITLNSSPRGEMYVKEADFVAGGTLDMTSTSSEIIASLLTGQDTGVIRIYGTWTGTIDVEGDLAGAGVYVPLPAIRLTDGSKSSSLSVTSGVVAQFLCVGMGAVRVKCSVAGTGTANVALSITNAEFITPVFSTTVDGTVAATQSGTWNVTNVSGTVSLPTGASTLTEQQTQTTHLATIAGDTTDIEAAVELIDDTVVTLGTSTYSEGTSKSIVIGAVRRDADTTLVDTTNEFAPLQVDANGRLKVEAFSGETLPVSLTSTTVTGTVAVTQSGTWDEVGINDSGNSITVDNNGTFAVQNTPALSTSGGWTAYHLVSAASTNATVVKASAGQLGGWYIYNNATSFRKVAFHNTASTPTAGSSVAWSMVIPPLSAANILVGAVGIQFSTGIAITTVTGLADSDSTGVSANDLIINLFYN